jgi:hypothetical protein
VLVVHQAIRAFGLTKRDQTPAHDDATLG